MKAKEKEYITMRFIMKAKWVVTLVTVAMLALGNLGVALADSPSEQAAKYGLFGSVTAKAEKSFTVKTNQNTTVVLAVTSNTKFRAPGDIQASLDHLAVGSRVAVLAEGSNALKVMVVPGEPEREHRVLTVIEVSGKTIVAQDAQGNRITVELDHEVSQDIKGQLVTFIGEKSKQSDRFKANVEVKIEQIVKRLEGHAKKIEAEAKVEASAEGRAKKERDLIQLKARLEANMQRHLDLFAEVIARVPEQARPALKAALEQNVAGYKMALEALGATKVESEAKLHLRTIHGLVENINAQAGEITIRSEGGAKVLLKMTADTQIQIDGKTGTLADVAFGSPVKIRYNSDTVVVAYIQVKTEAEVEAIIKSIDVAKGELTLTLPTGATLTLKLPTKTKVNVNGKKATAADLKPNALAEVEYNVRSLEVLEVKAETTAKVEGTIKSVDSAAGTATILTSDGKEIVLKVTDTTRVHIQGLLFGLLGITAGMKVEARYDLTTGIAAELKAKERPEGKPEPKPKGKNAHEPERKAGATILGTVGGIDLISGEITMNLDGGGTIILRTDSKTEIELNGEMATLASLKVGDRLRVTYNLETKVASELEGRPHSIQTHLEAEAHGTVQVLDAAMKKMVVRLRDSSTLELSLGADTIIRISGQPSKEADLKQGMEVEVQYRTDTNAALRINAPGRLDAEIHGTVQSVDMTKHIMVVRLHNGSTLQLALSGDTDIHINGQASSESDLKAGMDAQIRYRTDTGAVLKVNVTAKKENAKSSTEMRTSGQAVVSAASESNPGQSSANAGGTQVMASGTSTTVGKADVEAKVKIQTKLGQ